MLSDFLCLDGGERLYLNTFRYTPEMVDCKLCTEYRKTKGCTAQGVCPWLAERIEAGVVGYGEAVMGSFPYRPRLQARLTMAEQLFNGSLWADEQNQQRWYNLMSRFKYSKKRKGLAKYYAVIFLFSATVELNRRTIDCVERQSIEFCYADTFKMSEEDYNLFAAARSIAVGNTHRLLKKLEDISAVSLREFCLIVNALLIERYGLNAFNIK